MKQIILVIVVWALGFLALPVYFGGIENTFSLTAPDTFMRLEKGSELYQTMDWYDRILDRSSIPEGTDIHWTRPVDVLILFFAAPFLPFLDLKPALEIGALLFSFAGSLLLLLGGIWAVSPVIKQNNALLLALLFVFQPLIRGYLTVGRVDHHSILALLSALIIGCFIRKTYYPDRQNFMVLAGLLGGFGLWLSLEFLIVLLPLYLGIWICWVKWGDSWRSAANSFSVSVFIICVVATLIEAPPEEWLIPRYDKISYAQSLLVFFPVIFWSSVAKYVEVRANASIQIISSIIFGGISLAICWLLIPNIFYGPISETDPRIIKIWLSGVTEMRSSFGSLADIVTHHSLPLLTIILSVNQLIKTKCLKSRKMWTWVIVLLIVLVGAGILHIRTLLYAQVVTAMAFVIILNNYFEWIEHNLSGYR
ncbi:hypothetical protein KA005_15325, partial [bacterium]|nr:hypothetical protein [bacterium]